MGWTRARRETYYIIHKLLKGWIGVGLSMIIRVGVRPVRRSVEDGRPLEHDTLALRRKWNNDQRVIGVFPGLKVEGVVVKIHLLDAALRVGLAGLLISVRLKGSSGSRMVEEPDEPRGSWR